MAKDWVETGPCVGVVTKHRVVTKRALSRDQTPRGAARLRQPDGAALGAHKRGGPARLGAGARYLQGSVQGGRVWPHAGARRPQFGSYKRAVLGFDKQAQLPLMGGGGEVDLHYAATGRRSCALQPNRKVSQRHYGPEGLHGRGEPGPGLLCRWNGVGRRDGLGWGRSKGDKPILAHMAAAKAPCITASGTAPAAQGVLRTGKPLPFACNGGAASHRVCDFGGGAPRR